MSAKIIELHDALEALAAVLANTDYNGKKIGLDNIGYDWVKPTDVKSGQPGVAIVLDDDRLISEDTDGAGGTHEKRKAKLIISATWLHDQTNPTQQRAAPLESIRIAMAMRDAIKKAMKDADANGLSGLTLIEERDTGIEPRGHNDADRIGWVGQNWYAHYTRQPNT